MRSNEFGGKKDDEGEGESSSSSSSSAWETPRQLDMSQGGEHVVELRPRFEKLTLPAPLLKELLNHKDDAPAPEVVAAIPGVEVVTEAPVDEVRERETATGEHEKDDDEDEESSVSDSTTAAPVRVPVRPVAQASVVEQIIEDIDEQTRAEAAEPIEIDLSGTEPQSFAPVFENAPQAAPAPVEYRPPVQQPPRPVYRGTASVPTPPVGGGGMPPNFPPTPPTESAAFYYPEPGPETPPTPPAEWGGPTPAFATEQPYESAMYSRAFAPAEMGAQEVINQAANYAEQNGVRRGLVAGFIVGAIVASWVAGRKAGRVAQETARTNLTNERKIGQLQTAGEQMGQQLQSQAQQLEQFKYNQPPAPVRAPFEQVASQAPNAAPERFNRPMFMSTPNTGPAFPDQRLQQAPVPRQEQMQQVPGQQAEQVVAGQPGEQQVVLQPGQRLERRGWYSVVVDENGREVEGAINYGEAFQREQRQEHTPTAVTGQGGGGQQQDDAAGTGGGYLGSAGVAPLITSGQVDAMHELSAGQRAAFDHRLSPPKNQLATTLSSPWLWAGIVVLLIAFFVAALV